jgi:hypothetical protein
LPPARESVVILSSNDELVPWILSPSLSSESLLLRSQQSQPEKRCTSFIKRVSLPRHSCHLYAIQAEQSAKNMRVLLLNAHPDQGSLCNSIAAAYAEGAREGGHEVRCVALRELRFDLVLRGGYHSAKPLEPDVVAQQELIRWCQHLVVVTPNWWWSAPALLKGYIDRVFLPEFAMRYHARFPYVEPLSKGRSARVLYTQNSHGS